MDRLSGNSSPEKDLLAEMTSHTRDSGVDLPCDLDLVEWILKTDDVQMFPEDQEFHQGSNEASNHFAAEPVVVLSMPTPAGSVFEDNAGSSMVLTSPVKSSVPSSSSPAGTSVRSFPLRTQMKMQLQRDKALNEKKREESLGKNVGGDFRSSNPVNIQVATSPLQVVSQQGQIVNQKSSVLANPTLYHLQAKAKAEGGGGGKMARYSNGGGGGGSVPPGHASSTASAAHIPYNSLGVLTGKVGLHGSAPPNVYSGIQNNYDSVPASPLQPESVRSVNSITSGCSDNTSEYHNNDDLLNDGFNTIQLTDGQDTINSVASLPPQLLTGVGSTGRGHSGDGRLRVKGSSLGATARSAPTATGKVSPLSSEPDKDRKKKDNHNKIEKNRRKKINGNIHELAILLPKSSDEHFDKLGELKIPTSKGAILHHAVKYTKELQRENSEVKVRNDELKQELFEIRRELQRYKEICQSSGISLPQPTASNLIEKVEPQIKQEPLALEDRNYLPGDLAYYMEEDVVQGNGNVMLGVGEDDLGPSEVDLGLIGDMELT